MVQVLVYEGNGDQGVGVYGHVIGTDYTFHISGQNPDNSSYSNSMTQAGQGGFVFRGDDTSGYNDGLVYSDGASTKVIVNDANGNQIYEPSAFTQFGDESIFLATSASVSSTYPPRVLMRTDGDNPPEVLLNERVEHYVVVGDKIYARSYDTGDLFRIDVDGTTTRIWDRSENPSGISFMFEFDGDLVFRANDSNWDYDFFNFDSSSNVITELNIGENGGGDSIYYYYGSATSEKFYFWWNGGGGGNFELYASDGTSDGTQLVKDINPGSGSSLYSSRATSGNYHQAVGDLFFFAADAGTSDGDELWVSDGTAVGTFSLSGTGTTVGALGLTGMRAIPFGDSLLFSAYGPNGQELYITDGTRDGTRLVKDINTNVQPYPVNSSPEFYLVEDGLAYFSISGGPNNGAVWVTDGTENGTRVISDPSSGGSSFEPNFLNIVNLDVGNIPARTITGDDNVNILEGSFLDETILGLDGNDRVFDGRGNDTVDLGAGNDIVRVGGGRDSFDGGTGRDLISYYDAPNGVTVNLRTDTVSRSSANDDTISNFENVSGSRTGDDIIYGTTVIDDEGGANIIRTYGGNDRVFDYSGDDTVELGSGNDAVRVGGGQDSFDGGSGRDFISYYDSTNGVTVNLRRDLASGSWAEDDTVVNFESISGSRTGDDVIYGTTVSDDEGGANTIRTYGGNDRVFDYSGDDTVELGSGNDYVRVGGGTDSFDGGTGIDYISYYSSSNGVTVNLRTDTVSGSWAADDTVVNFESVSGSRTGDDVIYGTTVTDDAGGNNVIRTYGGNDRVFDYSGDDTVELGDDDDYVRVGGGEDSFDGGSGTDFISYYSSTNGVRLDFAADTAALSWADNDTVVNFEGASGSRTGDDDLRGDENENVFRGNGGEDRLLGRDGDDRLYGGDDNDRLFGGDDDDQLYGDDGNDFLHGGRGTDSLTGGSGIDTFHFDRGDGDVTVLDFENNTDVFQFDNFTGAAASSNQAFFDAYVRQQGNDVIFDFGADGTLTVADTTIGLVRNDFELV